MSKVTFHEVQGTIVKITDSRYPNNNFRPLEKIDNYNRPFHGDVGIHLITPAVDEDTKYCPAQETFFYGRTQLQALIDILTAAIAEPSSSVTEPNAEKK